MASSPTVPTSHKKELDHAPPDWKANAAATLAAIEAEIESLTACRDALRKLLGEAMTATVSPPSPAKEDASGKSTPPSGTGQPAAGKALGRILDLLRSRGPMRVGEIVSELGIGMSTATKAIAANPGLFAKQGWGVWGVKA